MRVPMVQTLLKEQVGGLDLHVHLNGDEAMCSGAAYMAANSTSTFRVRKVFLTQHPKHEIKIKLSPLDPALAEAKTAEAKAAAEAAGEATDAEDESIQYAKEVTLYKLSDYLGQRKTIHVVYDIGMRIDALAVDADGVESPLVTFSLPEIDEIMKKEEEESEKQRLV